MPDKIAVLLNPSAGKGKALRRKKRLEDCLKAKEINYDLFIPRNEEHLKQLAAEKLKEHDIIVSAAGDTTHNLIANEILEYEKKYGKKKILGMVGLGSANDITRDFGLDNIELACSAIKAQKTKDMDVGCLTYGGKHDYFLGSASLGLGPIINKYVDELTKKQPILAKSRAIDGFLGIYNSFHRKKVPKKVKLEYDSKSKKFSSPSIVFNNTRHYAKHFRLTPYADPFDGLLNAYVINSQSFPIFFITSIMTLLKKKQQNITLLKAKEFNVSSDEGIDVLIDGRIIRCSYKNITLSVEPSALPVIVPKTYNKR